MTGPISTMSLAQPVTSAVDGDRLRAAAVELEAAFLAEMLRSAGVGKTPSAFGGGVGEDQFASFLTRTQAEAMARAGGIGLAERLFSSLSAELRDDA